MQPPPELIPVYAGVKAVGVELIVPLLAYMKILVLLVLFSPRKRSRCHSMGAAPCR